MSSFCRLVKFEDESGQIHFADIGSGSNVPTTGQKLKGFASIQALEEQGGGEPATVKRLDVPKYPPLWVKPAAALADPDEEIPINDFCAKSLLDYEGELVFVTSKVCRDVSPKDAADYILGYTVGNDLSCRFFQIQRNSSGQFFYAKAFDKFAPIGPVLVSAKEFHTMQSPKLITRVNGEVRQTADLKKDMIFSPETILSHMSQGTTIPAGTAVMTGTAAGVGAFRKPKTFLQDGDIVEVEMGLAGTLSNKLRFE